MTSPIAYTNNQGTNYVAGLQAARDLLQNETIANDGNDKVLVFLSDGLPTKHFADLDTEPISDNLKGSGKEDQNEYDIA